MKTYLLFGETATVAYAMNGIKAVKPIIGKGDTEIYVYDDESDPITDLLNGFIGHETYTELTEGEYTYLKRTTRVKEFPNGFDSWMETHHEIVEAMCVAVVKEKSLAEKVRSDEGTTGLYKLAEDLTDQFEQLNEGRNWDGEFFDEVQEFATSKLYHTPISIDIDLIERMTIEDLEFKMGKAEYAEIYTSETWKALNKRFHSLVN